MLKNNAKTILVSSDIIKKTLHSSKTPGKKLLNPLFTFSSKNNLPLNILESKGVLENDAEAHEYEGDLWHCLEGTIEFVCGGELVKPVLAKDANGKNITGELKSKVIRRGKKFILKRGDWLWIPPGEPHKHITKTAARLFIIKIPIKNSHDKKN